MSFQDFVDEEDSDKKQPISTKSMIGIGVIILMVIGVAFFIFSPHSNVESEALVVKNETSNANMSEETERTSQTTPTEICVHIGGAVAHPGVCYLKEGARVADAVDAAGGMTEDAAVDAINLAKLLSDGEQIIVVSKEDLLTQFQNPAIPDTSTASTQASTQANSGKVNINTASSSELQTINGIGQSKAEKIIAYREKSGPFKSIHDLTNVSGIGEKTLESIKDYICV